MTKIVVGVDGSDASKDALRWAVDEARLRGAQVVAVNAWQLPAAAPDIGPMMATATGPYEFAELVPQLEESARLLVEGAVQEIAGSAAGVEIQSVAVEGPPARVLIDAARDADLLVVGSRGHGGFTGLLVGSVSLQAVQHAPCPVVICRHREPDGD